MKMAWMGFVVSFIAGYAAFSWHGIDWRDVMTNEKPITRASTSREISIDGEYEKLMLNEEERYEIALEKANRLTELLGLGEKMHQNDDLGILGYNPLVKKLARLFPQQALEYYGACPTDAEMNRNMYEAVLWEWGQLDFRSCSTYLASLSTARFMDLVRYWGVLARDRMVSHPKDCIEAFQEFSKEKQRDFIDNYGMSDALLEALLSVAKDQQYVAERSEKLAQEKQQREERAKRESDEMKNSQPKVATQVEALKSLWRREWPTPDVMVENIRALETRKERREMLDWVTRPRGSSAEEPQAWLQRISKVLQEVGDVPLSALEYPRGTIDKYQTVLAEWLPQQSPEMQRTWAESVVRFQDTHEALAWIEQLNTQALRHDMRDFAWERSVAEEPKKAAAALMQQATPHELEIHLPEAVYGWAKHDYAAAKQWLEAQPDSEAKTQALQKIEVK